MQYKRKHTNLSFLITPSVGSAEFETVVNLRPHEFPRLGPYCLFSTTGNVDLTGPDHLIGDLEVARTIEMILDSKDA